jgi:hypothetical protein
MILIAALTMTTLLASLFAPTRATPRAEAASPAHRERIDIVHDLVRIDVTRPAVRAPQVPAGRIRAASAVSPLRAASAGTGEASRRHSNGLGRAARALAGDGRHRPEPFPRLKH